MNGSCGRSSNVWNNKIRILFRNLCHTLQLFSHYNLSSCHHFHLFLLRNPMPFRKQRLMITTTSWILHGSKKISTVGWTHTNRMVMMLLRWSFVISGWALFTVILRISFQGSRITFFPGYMIIHTTVTKNLIPKWNVMQFNLWITRSIDTSYYMSITPHTTFDASKTR